MDECSMPASLLPIEEQGLSIFSPAFKDKERKKLQSTFLNPVAGISNTGRYKIDLCFMWEELNSRLLNQLYLTTFIDQAELCFMLRTRCMARTIGAQQPAHLHCLCLTCL